MEAKRSNGVVVIDYDCNPSAGDTSPGTDRFAVLDQLTHIRDSAPVGSAVRDVATAHAACLGALLGEQTELDDYVRRTQGCPAVGWTSDYVEHVGEVARKALAALRIGWDTNTDAALRASSPSLDSGAAGDVIQSHAAAAESAVRSATGATAGFDLGVETDDFDGYWSYWLDGAGHTARLRINMRRAVFNETEAYRFALHEVLGHAMQYANLSEAAEAQEVDWPRLMAVHGPHQVAFEGLAQVLPLAIGAEDERVLAQVRLDHYTQLVRAELHVLLHRGATARACRDHAAARVPFWTDDLIGAHLSDRGRDPQLRSYLWAYPAGLDWFVNLHDSGGSLLAEVLHAAYQRPLVPRELERLWPAGPRVGGNA